MGATVVLDDRSSSRDASSSCRQRAITQAPHLSRSRDPTARRISTPRGNDLGKGSRNMYIAAMANVTCFEKKELQNLNVRRDPASVRFWRSHPRRDLGVRRDDRAAALSRPIGGGSAARSRPFRRSASARPSPRDFRRAA